MATVEEIKSNIGNYSEVDLQGLLQDGRDSVKELARKELDSRATAGPVVDESYDPRKDPGPERYEDRLALGAETPLSAEEVDPEDTRRDETTVLASDVFDQEGNRINQ